jgi:hypothetical protein
MIASAGWQYVLFPDLRTVQSYNIVRFCSNQHAQQHHHNFVQNTDSNYFGPADWGVGYSVNNPFWKNTIVLKHQLGGGHDQESGQEPLYYET